MNWTDWYTDAVDVYRNVPVQDGALTRHERQKVLEGIPCRIYQSGSSPIGMSRTAAGIRQEDSLACGLSADIRPGDELIVTRGGRLGKPGGKIRAFAGDPNFYYEPFGAVMPGLGHQEIRLLQEERVDGLDGTPEGGGTP